MNKRLASERGIVAELALSIPVFFGLLISGMEVSRVAYLTLGMQNAVSRAGRYAALAGKEPGANPINSVLYQINMWSPLTVSSNGFKICHLADANEAQMRAPDSCAGLPNDRGSAKYWVLIEVNTIAHAGFGRYNIPVAAKAVVRNEPVFNINETNTLARMAVGGVPLI